MGVAMVHVGRVSVLVHQPCVLMRMRMRLSYRRVVMLMMLVMNVYVVVN